MNQQLTPESKESRFQWDRTFGFNGDKRAAVCGAEAAGASPDIQIVAAHSLIQIANRFKGTQVLPRPQPKVHERAEALDYRSFRDPRGGRMHGIEASCQIASFDPDLSFLAQTDTALFRFGKVRIASSQLFQL